jgi:DNA-binding transcriptional LysR family regulator
VRGRVAVGSPRTFGRHGLGPRLPALLSAHPELTVTVEYGVPSVLERRLAEGHIDLVILARPSELPGIETRPIATETFLAVAAPACLARRGQPRTAADFREHRYVVFDRDLAMHAPWWRAAFGGRTALPENIACEVASLEEMMALAIAGAAIAVLPDYQVADARPAHPPAPRAQHHLPGLAAWRHRVRPHAGGPAGTRRVKTVYRPCLVVCHRRYRFADTATPRPRP